MISNALAPRVEMKEHLKSFMPLKIFNSIAIAIQKFLSFFNGTKHRAGMRMRTAS
jgi:hypothetical protein